jgi:hypothetical protein
LGKADAKLATFKPMKKILGSDSWRFASDKVEAFLTTAGQLGPVYFQLPGRRIQPYAVAPWSGEKLPAGTPAVLDSLRGDFFCMPFGANVRPWRGEQHVIHGEPAAGAWRIENSGQIAGGAELVAVLRPRVRPGLIRKRLHLVDGQTVVYCRHELSGFSGPMCLGHHAMLQFPKKEGSGRIALSPIRFGQVNPQPFESSAKGGYSALKIGAPFRSLARVPLANGGSADLTRYPARSGYEDLVMVSARPAPLAWTTVAFPDQGYLWFALKDPRTLASTVLWHSNGGRHYPPWSGRHREVLGLEEVTAYFADGLAASAAPNAVSRRGIPTVLRLSPKSILAVNYVMGVAPLPKGFECVRRVAFGDRFVEFGDGRGRRIRSAVDLDFFRG